MRVVIQSIVLVAAVFPTITHAQDNEQVIKREKAVSFIVTADGQRKAHPISVGRSTTPLGVVGRKAPFCLSVRNDGNVPIRFPLQYLPSSTVSLISIRVKSVGGGEQASYPVVYADTRTGLSEGHVEIAPHETANFSTWFIPWVAGEYQFRVTLKNEVRNAWGDIPVGPDEQGMRWVEHGKRPIRNVWVGEYTYSGTYRINPIDASSFPLTKKEYKLKAKKHFLEGTGLWGAPVVWQVNELKRAALDAQKVLPDRINALNTLVGLRHMYATQALQDIEKKTRSDKVLHPLAVKSLCDMVSYGSGYLSLFTLCEIALDKKMTANERVLCLRMIEVFATKKELRHDGRVFHVIRKEDATLARGTIQVLRERTVDQDPVVRPLLKN